MRYSKLLYRQAVEKEDLSGQIKEAQNKLLDFNKPKDFKPGSKENILLMMDKTYQKTLFAFAENNIQGSQHFSMFEFRTAIEMLKERNEKIKEDNEKMKSR